MVTQLRGAKVLVTGGAGTIGSTLVDQLLDADVARPGVRVPTVRPGRGSVWHRSVVRVEERDRVVDELTAAGIGVGIHYPIPVHLTPADAGLGYVRGQFPVAEAAADRILSLPVFPHLTADWQGRVRDVLVSGSSS